MCKHSTLYFNIFNNIKDTIESIPPDKNKIIFFFIKNIMIDFNIEFVKNIHHWNDSVFTINLTRDKNFKFKNGEFVIIGMFLNNKFLSRAYSITSSKYDDYLEFLSIKIKNGLFTSNLKNIKLEERIYVGKKPTGTLFLENLNPGGENLWMISTGTGLSPFISLLKYEKIYDNYKNIILIHSVNTVNDLSYRYYFKNDVFNNKFFFKKNFKFIYYPIVTKENFLNNERVTNIILNKKIFYDININNGFDKLKDRVMICGNIEMVKSISNILENNYNFNCSKSNSLGEFVFERAFIN